MTPKPVPFPVPSPRQSDLACCHRRRPIRPGPGSCPVGPVRTSVGRPLHVPGLGPGWRLPLPTSGCQFRPSLGQAPQARTTLSPQSRPDMPAPLDSGHSRTFAGLCVLYRTPGWNCFNVQIGNGSLFGNLFRRGHFKKEETVEKVSRITRLYKRPQRSNENSTRGALLVRRCIVLFVPPAQPW